MNAVRLRQGGKKRKKQKCESSTAKNLNYNYMEKSNQFNKPVSDGANFDLLLILNQIKINFPSSSNRFKKTLAQPQ